MHIFITGAATGIGEATIDALTEKVPEAIFTIVDKNKSALDAVCAKLNARSVRNNGISCDLTLIEGLPAVVRQAETALGGIDLLINNAGIMLVDDFTRMSWDQGMLTMNLNYLAPARLMYEILPSMIARGKGGVINIASMAGKTLLPGCSWYGASKAGLGQLSEITGIELEKTDIHILTVYPGPIDTGLAAGARAKLDENIAARFMPVGDRETLARKIVTAYFARQEVLAYPEVYNTARHLHTLAAWFSRRLAPRTKP